MRGCAFSGCGANPVGSRRARAGCDGPALSSAIAQFYAGGPVGVETMAAVLSEQRDVIEDVIEPYLIQQGFLMRTPRGRVLTDESYKHLGLAILRPQGGQLEMLDDQAPETGS